MIRICEWNGQFVQNLGGGGNIDGVVTYTLDGAKTPKLPLQIALVRIVAESRDDERLEGVASNVGILGRFV